MTNIVQMPTPKHVLAQQLREDITYAEQGREQWIEGMLRQAQHLCEARLQFPSDNAFGVWLAQEEINIGQNDRAALITMGAEPELLRAILIEQLDVLHADTIWRKCKDRFGKFPIAKVEPAKLPEPPNPVTPVANNDEPPVQKPENNRPTKYAMRKEAVYAKAPRAKEIYDLFTHDGRDVLTKIWQKRRVGKEIWSLMVTALEAGLLVKNTTALAQPTLRLLFPLMPNRGYSQQFNMFNTVHRERIRSEILPAMIACKDKLFADPENTHTIVIEYLKEQHVQQKQAVVAEKHAVAIKAMAAAEQELVMFEHPVWPRPDNSQGEYSYDQARAAIWFFREYLDSKALTREDTKSFTIRVRNSLRYLNEYMKRTDRNNPMVQIFMLVFWFSYLMEKNPTGECKWPMYPHIEGQW